MRNALICGLMMIPCAGCTNIQLQRSMVAQAGTLSDIQYQQVLNNLAMFAGNRSAIPCQITISDGSAQVADLGSAGFLGSYGRAMGNLVTSTPSLVGSRTIVEQWGANPVNDDTELRLLQRAYRRAFGYSDTLDDDGFANDLAHELKKQVSVTDDLKDLNQLFYGDESMQKSIKQLTADLNRINIVRKEFDVLNSLVVTTNDDEIVLKDELVSSPNFSSTRTNVMPMADLLGLKPEEIPKVINNRDPNPLNESLAKRCTPVVQEVRRLLKGVEDDLERITPLWFGIGTSRKEVPHDACYVGYYADRCGQHYVWVCPDRRDELAKFTLTINGLSTLLKDPQLITNPGGPRFAPASAYIR